MISIPGDDDLAASADFMPLSMFPEPHRSNKDEAAVPAPAPAPVCATAVAGQHVQAMMNDALGVGVADIPMMPAGAAAACHPPGNPMESGVPPPAAATDGVPKTPEEIERAQLYVQEQIKKVEAQQQELRLLQEKTQREALATQQIQQQQQHQHQLNFNMMQYQAHAQQQQQQQHMSVPYPNSTMVQDQQGSAAPLTPHTYAMGAPAAAATFGTDDSHSASVLGSHVANTNTMADQSRQGAVSGGSVGSGSRSGSSSPGLNGNKKRHSDPNLLSSEASKKTKIAKVVATGIPSLLGRKVSEVVDLQNDSTDGTRKYAYTQVVGSTNYLSRPNPTHEKKGGASESPQDYLNAALRSRGYSTMTATSFDCGYPSQPTALQRSSYGVAVLRAVQTADADALSKLLQAGLSPNPFNAHGDSVLQMVCKRSDVKLFQTFLDNGVVLEIADPFGRTPLHFAAWAPASDDMFEIVTAMLDRVGTDILRVTDKNGKTSLQYLTVDKWPRWMGYLESKRDVYFPQREPVVDTAGDGRQQKPPRCSHTLEGKKSDESSPDHDVKEVAVVDPPNALSPEVAALVASGKVRPEDSREKATANVTPEA